MEDHGGDCVLYLHFGYEYSKNFVVLNTMTAIDVDISNSMVRLLKVLTSPKQSLRYVGQFRTELYKNQIGFNGKLIQQKKMNSGHEFHQLKAVT